MSAIDDALSANRKWAKPTAQRGRAAPKRRLAVLACMDARLAMTQMLGLEPGDAHIIRNAGGIVTEDAVRSLVISHHVLGTQEFMIVNHTDCGMLGLKEDDLRRRLERETGVPAIVPATFHGFSDLEENVARQIAALRAHPWIPQSVAIRGFVCDLSTGLLSEVSAATTLRA